MTGWDGLENCGLGTLRSSYNGGGPEMRFDGAKDEDRQETPSVAIIAAVCGSSRNAPPDLRTFPRGWAFLFWHAHLHSSRINVWNIIINTIIEKEKIHLPGRRIVGTSGTSMCHARWFQTRDSWKHYGEISPYKSVCEGGYPGGRRGQCRSVGLQIRVTLHTTLFFFEAACYYCL